MTKKFSIKLTRDPSEVFTQFKAYAAKNGVGVSGDHQLGQFNGKGIVGSYALSGKTLNITIEKKPMLLGWSLIENKVREFFV
jgi:hypothetical protein